MKVGGVGVDRSEVDLGGFSRKNKDEHDQITLYEILK